MKPIPSWIQVTVGCPHNRCTFCLPYKEGPRYKVRDLAEIKEDLQTARAVYGPNVRTLFFPAGNTIAVKTDDLCEICRFSKKLFPRLQRITVYGSSQYIVKKRPQGLKQLAEAGLSRIHVGLESGDDVILKRIRKGTNSEEQIQAGRWVMAAGIELSAYVILGIGGKERTKSHAMKTAEVINQIAPDFLRVRTLVPKIKTPLLEEVQNGAFQMLGPHEVLQESRILLKGISATTYLTSDHYTNYINLEGQLPDATPRLLKSIDSALTRDQSTFRPHFVGTE